MIDDAATLTPVSRHHRISDGKRDTGIHKHDRGASMTEWYSNGRVDHHCVARDITHETQERPDSVRKAFRLTKRVVPIAIISTESSYRHSGIYKQYQVYQYVLQYYQTPNAGPGRNTGRSLGDHTMTHDIHSSYRRLGIYPTECRYVLYVRVVVSDIY